MYRYGTPLKIHNYMYQWDGEIWKRNDFVFIKHTRWWDCILFLQYFLLSDSSHLLSFQRTESPVVQLWLTSVWWCHLLHYWLWWCDLHSLMPADFHCSNIHRLFSLCVYQVLELSWIIKYVVYLNTNLNIRHIVIVSSTWVSE